MNTFGQILFAIIFLISGLLIRQYINLCTPVDPPKLSLTTYWGPGTGENYTEKDEVQLQKIIYFDEPIKRIKKRLSVELITESLESVGFEYGVNSDKLRSLIEFWRDDYLPRWKWDREQALNRMPHYLTTIQG